MKQALEALEEIADEVFSPYDNKLGGAILAIREALAQPELTLDGLTPTEFALRELYEFQEATGCDTAAEFKAQTEQEPVAWLHTKIEGVAVPHRPADLDKHPDRWEALYKTPPPCPTCEALARTVMLDQTSHDTIPPHPEPVIDKSAAVRIATALGWEPKRKPLTDEQIMEMYNEPRSDAEMIEFARAIEAAHGIWPENSDCYGPDWTDRDGEYLK